MDIALKRVPFFEDAAEMFELIDQKELAGSISANSITDIYYISKKQKGHGETIDFLKSLIEIIEVIGIDKTTVIEALASEMKDFEDAILISAADFNGMDAIITRNKKDFTHTSFKVFTPKEFLKSLKS